VICLCFRTLTSIIQADHDDDGDDDDDDDDDADDDDDDDDDDEDRDDDSDDDGDPPMPIKLSFFYVFGAWPVHLLRQELGARQVGAGGGPHQFSQSRIWSWW
jgi:ABC-type Zn2+ transport system substrate-binding protein/surface adhesin